MHYRKRIQTLLIGLTAACFITSSACKKKAAPSPTTSNEWMSEFSTITTPITATSPWDLYVFSCKDPAGNLYLSGTEDNSWVVLKSSDEGESWNEEFSFGSGSVGYQIASDSLGNIFSVGAAGSPYNGTIKKYDIDTGLWSTAYSFQQQAGKMTSLRGVAVDGNDNIYAIGQATVTRLSPDGWPDMDVTQAIVLKSTDSGVSWDIVDSFAIDDYSWTNGIDIFIAETGEVYSYGTAQFGVRSHSFVRKSTDAGSTWTRVYEDVGSLIRGLAAWGDNLLLSEDFHDGEHNSTAARMRGTIDSFDHLTLLDSYFPTGATSIITGAMKVDSRGYAYYPIKYADADGASHLVLRGARADGEWETLDDYSVSVDEGLHVSEVMIDSDGSVYNVGIHYTDSATSWIIRKATLVSTTTDSPEDLSADGDDLISPIPSGAKRIYITSQTHDGNWGATAAAAIANADAFCNSDPNKPLVESSATYKALLVNSVRTACTTANCGGGVSENLDWVFAPSTSYVSREGTALGTTNSSGIFTTFSRALLTNAVDRAWTGLETANREWTIESGADNCAEWTTADSNSWATLWTPRGSDFGDIYTQNGWATCETAQRLICVEQ